MSHGWRPESPELDAAALDAAVQSGRVVAVHFWAQWDLHDRRFDQQLRAVRAEFANRVHFGCMDVDADEGGAVANRIGVLNLPALGIWAGGVLRRDLMGYRPSAELRRILAEILRSG